MGILTYTHAHTPIYKTQRNYIWITERTNVFSFQSKIYYSWCSFFLQFRSQKLGPAPVILYLDCRWRAFGKVACFSSLLTSVTYSQSCQLLLKHPSLNVPFHQAILHKWVHTWHSIPVLLWGNSQFTFPLGNIYNNSCAVWGTPVCIAPHVQSCSGHSCLPCGLFPSLLARHLLGWVVTESPLNGKFAASFPTQFFWHVYTIFTLS